MGYNFVGTYMGKEVSMTEPTSDSIDIFDIAYTLSHINRYNGTIPITVAQHCLFVSELVSRWTNDKDMQLLALLHDASEAYIGDMPSPLKSKEINSAFTRCESKLNKAIYEKYSLFGYEDKLPEIVKKADDVSWRYEAYKYKKSTENWQVLELINPNTIDLPELLIENNDIIEAKYIARVNELTTDIKTDILPVYDRGIKIAELIEYQDKSIGISIPSEVTQNKPIYFTIEYDILKNIRSIKTLIYQHILNN